MPATETTGRPNQRRRTRKDLLDAATRLTRQGRRPTLEEVAAEALVSRATAYRYFPSIEALHLEASVDVATPSAADILKDFASDDAAARLDRVDDALHDMILANEIPLRMMLIHSMERVVRGEASGKFPARQNRRSALIQAALEPVRNQFKPADLTMLGRAISLIVGPDSLIVLKDVLQLDDAESRKVKRWAIRALVRAALKSPPARAR